MNTILTLIAAGAAVGAGLWLLLQTVRGNVVVGIPQRIKEISWADIAAITAAIIVGGFLFLMTSWITASIALALGIIMVPVQLQRAAKQTRRNREAAALTQWIDQVRDLVNAGQQIEGALITTAKWAPKAIQPQLRRFVATIQSGRTLEYALRDLAEDFQQGAAARVAVALISTQRTPSDRLGEVLTRMADQARDFVALEQTIYSERHRFQKQAQMVGYISVGMVVALAIFSPDLIQTYSDGLMGELKQMVVFSIFAAGFLSLDLMNKIESPAHFKLRDIPGSTNPIGAQNL